MAPQGTVINRPAAGWDSTLVKAIARAYCWQVAVWSTVLIPRSAISLELYQPDLCFTAATG